MPKSDTGEPLESTVLVHPREGTPELTDTPDALAAVTRRLLSVDTPVAIDVERASGFRYHQSAYLLQIRREGAGTALIDTHVLADLTELSEGLAPYVWVMHSARHDLESMAGVGMVPTTIFDTEVAARLLGYRAFGLSSLCEAIVGKALDKSHQREDWSVRPLPHSWMRYAALDVELLPELYQFLATELHRRGRWEWAEEEFAALLAAPVGEPADREAWRINGSGKLRKPRELGVLRALWAEREEVAKDADVAPGRLIPNWMLIELARRMPRNRRQLLVWDPMRRPPVRAHTNRWLKAINDVRFLPADELPDLHPPRDLLRAKSATMWKRTAPEMFTRLQRLRGQVDKVAKELGLEREVVLQARVLRYLAHDDPAYRGAELEEYMAGRGARRWQIELTARGVERALDAGA